MNKNNVIVTVLVLVVIVFVGWFAYKRGYSKGITENEQDIEFNLPGVR